MLRVAFALALTAGLSMVAGSVMADEEQPPAGKPAQKPAKEAPAEDVFKVPDGNDSTVLALYLRRLMESEPAERTKKGAIDHLAKMDGAMKEIQGREISDELFEAIVQYRRQLFMALTQIGGTDAVASRKQLIEQLKASSRPVAKKLLALIELEDRISRDLAGTSEAKAQLVKDLIAKVNAADKNDTEAVEAALQPLFSVAEAIQGTDPALSLDAYKAIKEKVASLGTDDYEDLVEHADGRIKWLGLLGNPIEIAGKTLDGNNFDIKQLKGKVVLIDFWATWCGPCIGEIPHVKEMYEAYHDKGFEVVGISLDEDRKALEEFVDSHDLEWPTLWDEQPEKQGWSNPLAERYAISAIPAVILVNREGNVVHLNARGEVLTQQLAQLLGPRDDTDAESKKKE